MKRIISRFRRILDLLRDSNFDPESGTFKCPNDEDLFAMLRQAKTERIAYKEAYDKVSTELSRFRDIVKLYPRPLDRPRQLVFLHIQKTAGNSVLQFVGHQFDWFKTLQAFSPAEFDAYHPAEIAHFDLISGHLTARNLASVQRDALLFTFLREPVDRVVSCYWYFKTYKSNPRESIRHAVEAAKSKTLMDFLHDPTPEVRRHFVNHQAQALAGDWLNPEIRPQADLLADAWQMLERFDCVGVTERLEDGIRHLCRLLDWRPPSQVARDNVTPIRERVEDLAPAALAAIKDLNAVDIEVYRAARSKAEFVDKNTPHESETQRDAHLLRFGRFSLTGESIQAASEPTSHELRQ